MNVSLELLYGILAGFVGGGLCSLGLRWGISRRCYRLEVGLLDLQRVLLSLKGKTAADTRWQKQDKLEQEFKALAEQAPAAKARQFANDPLSWG